MSLFICGKLGNIQGKLGRLVACSYRVFGVCFILAIRFRVERHPHINILLICYLQHVECWNVSVMNHVKRKHILHQECVCFGALKSTNIYLKCYRSALSGVFVFIRTIEPLTTKSDYYKLRLTEININRALGKVYRIGMRYNTLYSVYIIICILVIRCIDIRLHSEVTYLDWSYFLLLNDKTRKSLPYLFKHNSTIKSYLKSMFVQRLNVNL